MNVETESTQTGTIFEHWICAGSIRARVSKRALYVTDGKRPNATTGWRRYIGWLKSPIISSSFVERDLRYKASYGSSAPCIETTGTHLYPSQNYMYIHI